MAEANASAVEGAEAEAGAIAATPEAAVVEDNGEAPKKKSKAMLFIIIGVLLLVIGGGAGFYFYNEHKKKKAKEEEEANSIENRLKQQMKYKKENKPPVFLPMDEFVVNLPGRGGEHYLQVKMVLRCADNQVEKKIADFLPVIRDRVITVLSSRSMQELATVEGKNMLAKEVALVINAIIEPQLTAIYVLQQEPTTADLKNLERIGAMPKETSAGEKVGAAAREAAAQFWRVSEMDLPVQAVLFNAFVMQ